LERHAAFSLVEYFSDARPECIESPTSCRHCVAQPVADIRSGADLGDGVS
jgi:hypothetical protein